MKHQKLGAAAVIVLSLQLLLSGCWFNTNTTSKVVNKNTGKTETARIVPGSGNDEYQMMRPLANDTVRGYIQYGATNLSDSDQLETGLMDLSKSVFSPNQYVFQTGQYLDVNTINSFIYRKGQKQRNMQNGQSTGKALTGMNPPLGKSGSAVKKAQSSPKYINYVLEQDYLKKNRSGKYTLGGVSIAVSLNSVYSDSITDSKGLIHQISVPLSRAKVKAWGEAHAPQILQRIRSSKGLGQVPILLTLYMTAAPNSLVSGDFFARTTIGAGSSTIGGWTTVDNHHVVFPSNAASSAYKADAGRFNSFRSAVQKYYPDYIDVIGSGFYQNGTLKQLTMNINMNKFRDQTEIIGFTNYVANIVNNSFSFPRDVPVQINIKTGSVQNALIERRPSMNNAFVSVYQH